MRILLAALLTVASLASTAPTATFAEPIDNGDGSQTCNASGPSGAGPGICANDMKTNEGYCDGGLSSEPGGGVTCAEGSTREPRRPVRRN